MDVDGTLTDGGVYLDGNGGEMKRFDIQDGLGLVVLMRMGVKVAFISGRFSPATERRAKELNITACVNGVKDKLPALQNMAHEMGISSAEVAYAGDDMPDVECIKWAGLGLATNNARQNVKAAADWCAPSSGGHGAIRDCAEYIIEYNGEKQ